jgi:hypothetical protein
MFACVLLREPQMDNASVAESGGIGDEGVDGDADSGLAAQQPKRPSMAGRQRQNPAVQAAKNLLAAMLAPAAPGAAGPGQTAAAPAAAAATAEAPIPAAGAPSPAADPAAAAEAVALAKAQQQQQILHPGAEEQQTPEAKEPDAPVGDSGSPVDAGGALRPSSGVAPRQLLSASTHPGPGVTPGGLDFRSDPPAALMTSSSSIGAPELGNTCSSLQVKSIP